MSEWKPDPETQTMLADFVELPRTEDGWIAERGEEREVSDETKVPEEHDGPPIQWRTCPYCVARNEPEEFAQFDPASDRCLASALDDNARYAALVAEKDKRIAALEKALRNVRITASRALAYSPNAWGDRWRDVLRFCSEVGIESNILREDTTLEDRS